MLTVTVGVIIGMFRTLTVTGCANSVCGVRIVDMVGGRVGG